MIRYFIIQDGRQKEFAIIETDGTGYIMREGRLGRKTDTSSGLKYKSEKQCQQKIALLIESLLNRGYVETTQEILERKQKEFGPKSDEAFFGLSYEDTEDGKSNQDLIDAILNYEKLSTLKHLTITMWEDPYEEEFCQQIIDQLIANSERFSTLESLRMGDMTSEDCEISWIIQADYSKLWQALPNLKAITIQGGSYLALGDIASDALESIKIITGGLPKSVLQSIAQAKTPNLNKLNLYLGVEDYGFNGNIADIKALIEQSDFPKLEYLGLCNSELQDDIAKLLVTCKYAATIKTLDLSKGTLSDKGAQTILDHASNLKNLQFLDLSYHYLSEEMQKKLQQLPFSVDVSDPQEEEDDYTWPMFTE